MEVLFSLSFNREKSRYEVFYAIGNVHLISLVRLRKSVVPYTEWIFNATCRESAFGLFDFLLQL